MIKALLKHMKKSSKKVKRSDDEGIMGKNSETRLKRLKDSLSQMPST